MITIDLSSKNALVTGGTGEIGRSIVRTLSCAGANVAIHYKSNLNQANKLLQDVQAAGVYGITVQADVTQWDSVVAMRDQIVRSLGEPDIIVTSAVIQYKWTSIFEQEIEDYESQFRSSVLHNVFMAKAFIPSMINKKWGRFIGINTECSMLAMPRQSAYVASKRGMDGVLRVLAREVGEHNITVNQVAPGWTVSEGEDRLNTASVKNYIKNIPLQRRGTDKEIAGVVAFLASNLAGFITGAYIPVCGGNIMPSI